MLRNKYRKIFITILLVVTSMLSAIVVLAVSALPYAKASVNAVTSQFAESCGCTQYIPFEHHPYISLLIGAIILGAIIALSVAIIRSILMIVRTAQFSADLRSQIVSTTRSRGISIHRIQNDQPIAVSVGIFKPVVYLSTGLSDLLTPWELWAVVRHELDHAVHYDPGYRFVISIVQSFFPFASPFFQYHHSLQELAADEAVGDDTQLKAALLKMFDAQKHLHKYVVATFFSANEARVNRLIGETQRPPQFLAIVVTVIAVLSGVAISYQTLAQEEYVDTVSTCLAEQSMCEDVMSHVEFSIPQSNSSSSTNDVPMSLPQ